MQTVDTHADAIKDKVVEHLKEANILLEEGDKDIVGAHRKKIATLKSDLDSMLSILILTIKADQFGTEESKTIMDQFQNRAQTSLRKRRRSLIKKIESMVQDIANSLEEIDDFLEPVVTADIVLAASAAVTASISASNALLALVHQHLLARERAAREAALAPLVLREAIDEAKDLLSTAFKTARQQAEHQKQQQQMLEQQVQQQQPNRLIRQAVSQ